MSEVESVFIEPLKLTEKFSRYTKGILISLFILMVTASLATIGEIIGEWITMTIGYVIAGICSVSALVFVALFLANIKNFDRIDPTLRPTTNRIFVSLLCAFFFAIAGFASVYGDVREMDVTFFVSRLFGLLALACFLCFFISINRLFKKLQESGKYPKNEKIRKFLVILVIIVIIETLLDTILRPILVSSLLDNGSWTYERYTTVINKPMSWINLSFLLIAIIFICYELYKLSSQWLKIDNEINEENFQLPLKSFDEVFETRNLLLSIMLSLSLLIAFAYAFSYLLVISFGDVLHAYQSYYGSTHYSIYSYLLDQVSISFGPFVGIAIVFAVNYIIRMAFHYHKISQLNKKTANYGIIMVVLFITSPFVIIAGFFFNIGFRISNDELYLISRILIMIGILLFSISAFFMYKTLKELQEAKDTKSKKDEDNTTATGLSQKIGRSLKYVRSNFELLSLLLSSILIFILLLLDTIIRSVMFRQYYGHGDSYSVRAFFVVDSNWLGYIVLVIFTLAMIGIIYGINSNKNIILKLLPDYGRIPVKRKKSQTTYPPVRYTKAVEKPTKQVSLIVDEEREGLIVCTSCGGYLEEKFRFCPSCGIQEERKESVPKASFCANCGDNLDDKFKFCPLCGIQIK